MEYTEGQSRVCTGEEGVNPRVRGARSYAEKFIQGATHSSWWVQGRPISIAEKLSIALWAVIKEPEKQQGSQRNLNL